MKKNRNSILLALSSLLLAACTPSTHLLEGGEGSAAFSLYLDGRSLEGADLRNEVETLRVISLLDNYNQLATKEGEGFKFTLPTRKKQTLFFVANEKTDLASLKASTFNQTPLKTADYFKNNGRDDPKLYVATQQIQHNASGGGLPLELYPAYAKLSFEIRKDPLFGPSIPFIFSISEVTIKNVPTQFMLGGVKTQYPADAEGYTTFPLLKKPPRDSVYRASCYLPEHDPADGHRYPTTIEIKTFQGRYSVAVKEPYSSVEDGKIVRGKHYKIKIRIQSPPVE